MKNQLAGAVSRMLTQALADGARRPARNYGSTRVPGPNGNEEDDSQGGGRGTGGVAAMLQATASLTRMATAVGAVTTVLSQVPRMLEGMGAAIIRSQQHLTSYSAAHAIATSQLEANRMLRAQQSGQARGSTFEDLARAQNNLEEQTRPWADLQANISARITAGLEDGLATWMKSFNEDENVQGAVGMLKRLFGIDDEKDQPVRKTDWDRWAEKHARQYDDAFEQRERENDWRL